MTYPGLNAAEDPDRAAVEERRLAREKEYGQYVAASDIPWGNVIAFKAGDAVPASTVDRLGWVQLGFVAKVGTKAADAVTGATTTKDGGK